jgi:hypothetical protein
MPLDGPIMFSVLELAAGLVFGKLYLRARRKEKPLSRLQWRLVSIRKTLSSKQYWFACFATGLLGTCWIGVMLDLTGNCQKADFWNWHCQAEWSSRSTGNTSSDL